MDNGIEINGHRLNVKIRCFICDAPARNFIKGTINFNGYRGCLKCEVHGEFENGHMSFPQTDVARRTDESFRNKTDPKHHRSDSLLLPLQIDMVQDVIVCDMLHQLHVGIMKNLLLTFCGEMRNKRKKASWRDEKIKAISQYLVSYKIPDDINRKPRPLDCVLLWKGTEFHTFLMYIGPVVLNDYMPDNIYEHFLALFVSVSICSSHVYSPYLPAANLLLSTFIELYIVLYGEDLIGCNVHNLCHMVEEVNRFGPLPSFSTYPFENELFQIKRLLRNGNKPLVQVAKRLLERDDVRVRRCPGGQYPMMTKPMSAHVDRYMKVFISKSFSLSPTPANKWFLTKRKEIVSMEYGMEVKCMKCIAGKPLIATNDFFIYPIRSSDINIFISNGKCSSDERINPLEDIAAKLFCLQYHNDFVFIPLLHTLR